MSIDAMKQALEALYNMVEDGDETDKRQAIAAITALRLAIEQAERQEPHFLHCICGAGWEISADGGEELVDAPPQRQPLTDEEIKAVIRAGEYDSMEEFARAIERKHGIGGGE